MSTTYSIRYVCVQLYTRFSQCFLKRFWVVLSKAHHKLPNAFKERSGKTNAFPKRIDTYPEGPVGSGRSSGHPCLEPLKSIFVYTRIAHFPKVIIRRLFQDQYCIFNKEITVLFTVYSVLICFSCKKDMFNSFFHRQISDNVAILDGKAKSM